MQIVGKDLRSFSIRTEEDGVCLSYAAEQLRNYIRRALGFSLDIVSQKTGNGQIVLTKKSCRNSDVFRGFYKNGDFYLEGESERAVLYAVYDFLEKFVGWRFFASRMQFRGLESGSYLKGVERLVKPRSEITLQTYYEERPVIVFRDFYGHATVDEDWCAKNKINGDLWGLKNTPEQFGGAERFASSGGHSFTELLNPDVYYEKHPEYYPLIDGKRIADGQICLMNEEVFSEVVKNAKEILKKNPTAKYISVSQNDNNGWCQCERCAKKQKEIGLGGLLFGFVNRVADALEEEYPTVKIHTFAYDSTAQDCNVKFHKNVVVQYCLRCCRGHDLDDPSCVTNAIVAKQLKGLSENCEELFIYDYLSGEAHLLQFMPDLFLLRKRIRFLADCKVRGIYSEMDIFNQNSPCMEELRAYVYAKLMWNPYMSDEEYNEYINEFLQGYYGKGWKHIRNYLEIWAEATKGTHYDSVLGNIGGDDGHDVMGSDGIPVRCAFMPKEKIYETCAMLEEEISLAEAESSEEEWHRIHLLRAGTLWYRLFHTMKEIMQNGTEEEKRNVVADNRELCSLMRRYCMKYTCFIAMSETTAMYRDFTLPPEDWNYWEKTSRRAIFNEFLEN